MDGTGGLWHEALPGSPGRPEAEKRAAAGRWARQRPSRSATSVAVGKRPAGSLAISRAMIASSHAGTSGLISRSGRGSSSETRRSTASG